MSTYINRIVEVRHAVLDGCFCKKEDVEALDLKEGQTYRTWDRERKYWRVIIEDGKPTLKEIEAPDYRWDVADWWTIKRGESSSDNQEYYKATKDGKEIELERHISFIDNGGSIRDKYLSSWYDFGLDRRGWPDDISEDAKKDGEDEYCYNKTYVLLSEYRTIFENEQKKYEQELKEEFEKGELVKINQKLDALLNKTKFQPENNEDEEEYYEDDDIRIDIEILADEITKIESIASTSFVYPNDSDIRVLYYFC